MRLDDSLLVCNIPTFLGKWNTGQVVTTSIRLEEKDGIEFVYDPEYPYTYVIDHYRTFNRSALMSFLTRLRRMHFPSDLAPTVCRFTVGVDKYGFKFEALIDTKTFIKKGASQ